MWRYLRSGDILRCRYILYVEKFYMWKNFICGEILDVKKFEMYRVKYDMYDSHCFAVALMVLCCFVAKSVQ